MAPKEEQSFRRKRNVRTADIPPIVLTERDRHILEMVYQCRVLRQDQLHALFFGKSTSASQRRLALLYHHGFLTRRFLTVRASYMLSPALYLLDKRGVDYLRTVHGEEAAYWKSSDHHIGQQFLEHTLAINDVRVAFTLACRTAGYRLSLWHGEAFLKAHFDRVRVIDRRGHTHDVSLIPDSYFVVETPDGIGHFFLELDRGTMTTARYQAKIAAYLTYYASGAYEARYNTKSLRILTVTLSPKRQATLKRASETVGAGTRFWFGLLSDLLPTTILHTPLWSLANRVEREALFPRSVLEHVSPST